MVLVVIKKKSLQRYRHAIFISRFSSFPFKPFTKGANKKKKITLIGISLFLVYTFGSSNQAVK